MTAGTVKVRLLEYAVERLGRPIVSARLGVSESVLEAWIARRLPMPNSKQLALADLISDLADDEGKTK
jgi:hypothetical protein